MEDNVGQQVEDTQQTEQTEQVNDTVQNEEQPQVEDSTDLSGIDPTQLTPEQVVELQQGYMRDKDYTQKTQDLASTRQELATENKWFKQQAENLSQRPEPQTQPQQQSAKVIDSYIANAQDAETKMYWQNMKQIVNETATEIANSKIKATEEKMAKIETAYMQREGQRMLKEFRNDNPGIKSGSVEEKRVIELMNQGYPMEHAAIIAQGEGGFKAAENRGKQQAQQKFQQKRQANVESSSGIPNSSLPANQKSERDLIGEALDDSPLMK